MLSVQDLSGSRGERRLFSGISFALQPGEWLRLAGANGAGKTTLLRILSGLSPADGGHIAWQGQRVDRQISEFRAALLYLGHHAAIKDELSPLENLQQMLALDGFGFDAGAAGRALARLGLRGRELLPARVLSAGQRRRLLQARLLLRPARLWLLDEPFNALDDKGVQALCELVGEHLQGGGMAVLTSHQPIPLAGGRELRL